jgi:hypothetical protein
VDGLDKEIPLHRRYLATALLTTALVATPSTALAQEWVGVDAQHDVVESTYSDEPAPCGTTTSTTLPGNTFYDITSVNVWHGLKALHVKVNVRDLPRSRAFDGLAGVATDGRDFILDVSRFKDGGATETFFAIQPEQIDPPDECGRSFLSYSSRFCRGVGGTLRAKADYVDITIPRRCIGDPKWVRVSAQTYDPNGTRFDQWEPAEATKMSDAAKLFGPYGPRVSAG